MLRMYKKISLSLLLLLMLAITHSYAQKLSINELLALQKNKNVKANEFFNDRGWSLIRTEKQDSGWLEMMWEKGNGGNSGAVLMHIYKGDLADLVRITYLIKSREIFNALKTSLPSGFEYEESTAKQGLACSNYTNGNIVILYCNVAESVQGEEVYAVSIMYYADYATGYRKYYEVF